ncbi:hypothetical protein [Brevibacillus porteri]|uniref:hypothetical protein n=1 Tax=Brevibacillus porteri TaxID=2126350 RepID=UPI001304EADA|nr:hypothetical protein [Brevibacillus porteri]MED1801812.1 hypothetical protein [Brevibacillus porteri]MED2134943.1 hypothetical protein [Brevibacillus porteri]MED2745465.1 hypothetical protein [Brevibacillus porteri]MED2815789.1 hypothetical protein [Brevibacillus porteri]MED2897627.1 hypothetical protein [Brevibacillus porteri]
MELQIEVGKTYHNDSGRHRTVVGFSGHLVNYKMKANSKITYCVAIWEFEKWAKGVVVR